jgi:hypothetical protein
MDSPVVQLECAMEEKILREEFDTGLSKIKQEIKSCLVPHGLFGTVTSADCASTDDVPAGSRIELVSKGRTVGRSFGREQIEGCCLRVGGDVLLSIMAMVDEVSASPR